jgi:hypothetical protein
VTKRGKKKSEESWKVIAGPNKTEYNFIFVDGDIVHAASDYFVDAVIKDFDFGFCQVAYNGTYVKATEAFKHDITHQQMNLNDDRTTTPERVQRLRQKYPDWELGPGAGMLQNVGEVALDGSIYLGHDSKQHWYVTAENAKYDDAKDKGAALDFNQAAVHAKKCTAHGHHDWQVPPKGILQALYRSRQAGAFKGMYPEKEAESDVSYSSSFLHFPGMMTFPVPVYNNNTQPGEVPADFPRYARYVRTVPRSNPDQPSPPRKKHSSDNTGPR